MIKDIVIALLNWSLILVIRIPATILGLVIVPIGLLFKVESNINQPFSIYNTDRYWWHVGLPKLFYLWSNARDGLKGDKRGWYDAHTYFKNSDSFLSQWWWGAIRNPVNNMRFIRGISVNMTEAKVSKLAGQDFVHDDKENYGWNFLKATGPKFSYYSFYYVGEANKESKAWVFYIGHKILLRHNTEDWSQDPQKAWKGFTIRAGHVNV